MRPLFDILKSFGGLIESNIAVTSVSILMEVKTDFAICGFCGAMKNAIAESREGWVIFIAFFTHAPLGSRCCN